MKIYSAATLFVRCPRLRRARRKLSGRVVRRGNTDFTKQHDSDKPLLFLSISGLSLYLLPLVVAAEGFGDVYRSQIDELLREVQEQRTNRDLSGTSIDQHFVCSKYNVGMGSPSSASHYIDFGADGSASSSLSSGGQINLDPGGSYTASLFLGLASYRIWGGGSHQLGRRWIFSLGNVQQTDWQRARRGVIRYFNAEGRHTVSVSEQSPEGFIETTSESIDIEMYCQATEHGYNTERSKRAFECPRHATPEGEEENVFVFNALGPGNIRRERSIYVGAPSPSASTEESNVGMYWQNGNDIVMDFNVNPTLGLDDFSDYNELNAHLLQNGSQWQLEVDEFPPGENVCDEVQP